MCPPDRLESFRTRHPQSPTDEASKGESELKRKALSPVLTILVGGARLLYAGLKLLPVQRKVVLITREPRRITVDFALLQEAVQRDYPEHTVVLIKHKKLSFAYAAKAVREMYHLATCQACVVDGYIIPVSILNHREQLRIAQVWHALGAIKNFGHLASGTREGPHPKVAEIMQMHKQYTFITAAGSVPAGIYTAAFGVPQEAVHPLGMPRVDYLLDRERMDGRRAEILEAYPQLQGRKVVLYAPTFRRGQHVPYTRLATAMDSPDASLVLVPHPLDKSPLPEGDHVVIGRKFGVLDWLSIADTLITDYSAVAYEATLRDIPLVFWPYDMDEYMRARGLAIDYDAEVPGPVVETAAEAMAHALRFETPDYSCFRSRHLDYVTEEGALPAGPPGCTEAIIRALELR